jgi:O-antigen ligase
MPAVPLETDTAPDGVRTSRFDAVTLLSIFIFALIAIPSQLVVGALGAAGTPAEILGMGLLPLWAVFLLSSPDRDRLRQPIRIAMWTFVVAIMLSYIAASLRAALSDERLAADRGLLMGASWLGLLMASMDMIPTRERLDVLLRRLVIGGGALASLGVFQFITKQPWVNYIEIPGLSTNSSIVAIYGRDGFTRPAGTAIHPIEFGAALTMILPIALHFAFTDTGRSLLRRWYPVVAIAVAVPISISRSAIVSSIVVLCFLVPSWAPAIRRKTIALIGVLCVAMYIAVPGLLGVLTGLFTGISQDSSAQSRTGSYSLALEFFGRTPFFGRGFQTFLPAYRIFDNQWLGLLVETGIFGVMAFLFLLMAGVVGGLRVKRRSSNRVDASLGRSLAAAIGSALVSIALFDGFSFPMAGMTIFLILGCIGALRRLTPTSDASGTGELANAAADTKFLTEVDRLR